VILHPAPPDGPTAEALHRRADQLLVLTHPTIAAPIATGRFEERAWVVDPVPPGVALATRILDRGTLSLREGTAVLREVARALTALHRRDLAHGALTAATVMIDRRGTVLAGFGLSTDGTPADDLRALGALAWEMLVGTPPTERATLALRIHRPSAPAEMELLVAGLLGQPGAPRLAKAEDVLAVLDRFPPLAPDAIADFLDGVGAGNQVGRRRGPVTGRWLGTLGGILGRLRGR
jgi:serine/threonine protein kinase